MSPGETVSASILEQMPLFENFNETECRQLAEISRPVSFLAREVVLRQGENSQHLWIVIEGKCEVIRETEDAAASKLEMLLAEIGPHSIFGEMSFFHKVPHSASVRAVTPVKLIRIAKADFDELIQDGALGAYKLAYNALGSLAERLRRMDEWVSKLRNSTRTSPLAAPTPAVPAAQINEWRDFRDKLFTGWNL